MRFWAKRLGWALVWLVTLIVLLVQFENWRGRRAWAAFVAEMKSEGDDPSIDAIRPPPVPDEENLAMAPLFRSLLEFNLETNKSGRVVARLSDNPARKHLDAIEVTPTPSVEASRGWRGGQRFDVATWQAAYRADTNFPSRPQPATPGADVLFALEKFDSEFVQLREAAARPHSRFPVRYEDSFAALLPHLQVIKRFSVLAQLRALAALAEGKKDDAAVDALLALRLADVAATEPILISQLVRIAQIELAMQPLWEGVLAHAWNDAQLGQFEARLSGMDLLEGFHIAIRGERNFGAFAGLDMMRNESEWFNDMVSQDGYGPGSVVSRLVPDAFFDQSKVVMGRMFRDFLKTVEVKGRRVDPAIPDAVEKQLIEGLVHPFLHPYQLMAGLLMPAMSRAAMIMARGQTTVDLARVAIALERHRLKHGTYPPTLDALDELLRPVGGIPHDVISGGPLRYAPTADGQFQLYAVGWNATDDGGSVVWDGEQRLKPSEDEGDWVWPALK